MRKSYVNFHDATNLLNGFDGAEVEGDSLALFQIMVWGSRRGTRNCVKIV